MIKQLTQDHKQQIIDYCLRKEHENLFILGSFKLYQDSFKRNLYFGYFDDDNLKGVAVYFKLHKSFVIHAPKTEIINKLVDYIVEKQLEFTDLPVFKKYGDIIIKRLKTHNIQPKKVSSEYVMTMKKEDFNNFETGEESQAQEKDRKDIAYFNEKDEEISKEKLEEESKKVIPETTFILRKEGKIVSKVNLHGYSKTYFQIGGMVTHPDYRNKGYAKQVLSTLCKHYFNEGLKYALLFTAKDNIIAQKVYKKLGFKVVDEFIIARF